MTRQVALAETATRNLEAGAPYGMESGIPWLCRPSTWAGMGRAVAVTFKRLELGRDSAVCSILVLRHPEDDAEHAELDHRTGGEWEVIRREVWQQERRHGAS